MKADLQTLKGLPISSWADGPTMNSDVPFSVAKIDSDGGELGAASSPQRSGFYEIFYITGGSGTWFLDFEDYPIAPASMFFVNPGQVHYANVNEAISGYRIAFPEDFLSIDPSRESTVFELAFFQNSDRDPIASFDESEANELVAIIDSTLAELDKRRSGYVTVLRSYLHILLVRASRGFQSPVQPRSVSSAISTTRRFRQLVTEQVRTVRSVNSYAQQLGISPGHLHDVVKSTTGVTPSDIIQQELMLEAKRLLAHTDMSIAEVGHHLCFDDPAYFGRYFRRNQKRSPGQYRNQVRKMFWSANAESAA